MRYFWGFVAFISSTFFLGCTVGAWLKHLTIRFERSEQHRDPHFDPSTDRKSVTSESGRLRQALRTIATMPVSTESARLIEIAKATLDEERGPG
jgi:hypothetical protein